MKKFVILCFLALFTLPVFSQNETKKWYFGDQAGLDFMTSPPTALMNGSMTTQEGCASIADAVGNLLFYTDGITVWNSSHAIMSNGTGLLGNGSSTQSGVIVKQPGSSTIYYVFTLDAYGNANGLRYSVVDMSLSSGSGSVTIKNVLLQTPSSEKLTAVKHCNGTDVWVISHDLSSDNFRTFLVTAAGVNTTPVNSAVGTVQQNMLGNMKTSPNGRKLGLAIYTTDNTFELYDFDNATGVVSNSLILGSNYTLPYGCEFSPDGKLFYGCNATASFNGIIYQWDLCAGSPTAIVASQVTVATTPVSLGSMQLGPDGKIYVSRYLQTALGVINSPDLLGATACNYVDGALSVSPKICRFGLPNFVTSFLKTPPAPYTYTLNPALSCLNASFTAPPTPTCGSTAYTVSAYKWLFGDPASVASDTSLLANPTHSFTAPGTYTTQLVLYYTCGTDTLKQAVVVPSPTINIITSPVNCAAPGSGTVTYSGGNGPYSYSWMPSGETASVATNLVAGSNSVILTNSVSGCSFTASANVGAVNFFTLAINTVSLECNGTSTGAATINVTGVASGYSYSLNGVLNLNPHLTGLYAGTYTVSAQDSATYCVLTKTFQIVQPAPLTVTVSAGSPSMCTGNTIVLTANVSGGTPGYSYSWNGIPLASTYTVPTSPAGIYDYTVYATDTHSCSASDSVSVEFYTTSFLTTASLVICPGTAGTLTAAGANSYTWQGIGTGNAFTVSPASPTTYTVVGDSAGCVSSATVLVDLLPLPTITFDTHSITCASLSSGTVFASGGTGPFSYTWTPTLQTTSVAAGLYPGNYTVTVRDAGTGCVLTPTRNFAPLVPFSGTVAATSSVSCYGATTGTAGILLSGGSGTQTYTWTNIPGIQTSSVASSLGASVHTVTVVDGLTFCSVTRTFLITGPPAFTLNVTASSPSVCLGGTITYTALNSGGTPGYTYSWAPQGITANTLSVGETVAGQYIYTITSSDAHSCEVTHTVSGLFVNNPVVSVSNTSVCPLAVGTLTASGATSYSWNNGSSGNMLSASPATSTSYTVTGSALGCTAIATGGIFLKTPPTASFTSNANALCQGDSLQLLGIGTGLVYLWSGPLSFSSGIQNPGTFYFVTPNRSGNYTLKVTAPNSCTASIIKSITVNPPPTLTVSGATVCEGSPLHIFSNFLAGGSYSWTGPASYTSSLQNLLLLNSVPAMSGSYTLVAASAANCTNVATTQASVISLPVPVISVGNPNCAGSALVLNGSGGAMYSWFGPNGYNSTVQNPTLTNIATSQAGTYSLFVSTGSCVAGTSTIIVIHPAPTLTVSNNSPLCEFSTLSLLSQGSAQSYTWSGPAGFSVSSQNSFINMISLAGAGVYSLSAADANNCISKAVTIVTILPAPLIIAEDKTVCIGGAVTLTASGGTGYLWSGPLNFSSAFSSAFIPVVNPGNTGIYTVTVIGTNSCIATSTLQLNGFPFAIPILSISASGKPCLNSTIVLQGSGGMDYYWSGPAGYTATAANLSLTVSGQNIAGIYTLSARNESYCAATATLLVDVFPQPAAQLMIDKKEACVPFCSEIKLELGANIAPVVSTLYNINAVLYKDSVIKSCFTVPGSYVVSASFKDTNTCINTATLLVNAYARPEADFNYTPLNPLAGIDRVQFYNNTIGSSQMDWTWFLSSNDTSFVKDQDPAYLFEESGIFPLVLIAKNKWGCIDTVIKTIQVNDEFRLYVPNAFTPTGDGLNDSFQPKGEGIVKYNLTIYNRWGQLLFDTGNFYTGWDGTYRGKECKTDSYIWKIILTNSSGNTKSFTGNVSLLRAEVKEAE